MIFPQSSTRKWASSPNDEPGADLVITRALNLLRPDRIRIGKKPIVLFTNNDDTDFGVLLSIQSDENGYYFVTSKGVFRLASFGALPVPTKLSSTNEPNQSLGRDGVMFNGSLHVGGGAEVKFWSGTAWTTTFGSGVLSASFPIRLCNFVNKRQLAVGNGNNVYLYDTTYALKTTLTIPTEYVVTGMEWRQNNLYIFTRNVSGGQALMFVWSGAGTDAQYGFPVEADWIYAGCTYDNSIAIVTSAGQLLRFNSGGFDILENLPVYNTPYSWFSNSSLINGTGKMSARGMTAIGKRLILSIDGSVTVQGGGFPGVSLPQQPSGVWEYTPDVGLVHEAGYCHTKYSTLSVHEIDSGNLVFSTPHGLVTGDAFYLSTSNDVTGLVSGQTYFAIVDGANAFAPALSPGDAVLGKKIAIAGTGGDTLCVDSSNEIGATLITAPGAIGLFNKNIENAFFGTEIMFGGETPNDAATNVFVLMSMGMGRNRGVFSTCRVFTGTPTDVFNQLSAFINDMSAAFEQMVVKWRTKKLLSFPTQVSTSAVAPVVWTSSTSFTAAAANRDLAEVVVGNEMTVVQGAGSGYSAHVLSCALSGSTWTVTLDEPIGNIVAGNESEVQFDNWTKEKVITNADSNLGQGYANVNVGSPNAAWLELKIEMRGRDHSLDRIAFAVKNDKTQS